MEDSEKMEEEQGMTVGDSILNGECIDGVVGKSSGLPHLPEACIATIFSCLPPQEVAKAACVCKSYHSASQSDSVWAKLLPPGHKEMLELITDPKPMFKSQKDIYNYLTTPKLFAEGTKAYWIDRETGGVILSISARGLRITWGDTYQYWNWIPSENSLYISSPRDWTACDEIFLVSDLVVSVKLTTRFPEVAQLKNVCWFEACGDFEVALPPGSYTLSWRIQLEKPSNFGAEPVHFSFSKNDLDVLECKCYIDPRPQGALRATENYELPTIRVLENHWQEYDVAEFSVDREEPTCMLKISLRSIHMGLWKSGISMDGIVIRPTNTIKDLQIQSSQVGPSIAGAHGSVEGARFRFPDILQSWTRWYDGYDIEYEDDGGDDQSEADIHWFE